MRLEDYFDFLSPDDIRLKGHRIGLEDVILKYLDGYAAEEIVADLPTLSLEEVHATITYYLHNQQETNAYLHRLMIWRETRYQEAVQNPSPLHQRLQQAKQKRHEAVSLEI